MLLSSAACDLAGVIGGKVDKCSQPGYKYEIMFGQKTSKCVYWMYMVAIRATHVTTEGDDLLDGQANFFRMMPPGAQP